MPSLSLLADAATGLLVGFPLVILLIAAVASIFWLWMLIDAITNPSLKDTDRIVSAISAPGEGSTIVERRGSPVEQHLIETQNPRAVASDVEEHEAVDHRRFALVHNREEFRSGSGVDHEIRHGHLSAQDERRDAAQQPEGHQKSTDQFNPTADDAQSVERVRRSPKHAEHFLAAVAGHEQADKEAHERESDGGEFAEKAFHKIDST